MVGYQLVKLFISWIVFVHCATMFGYCATAEDDCHELSEMSQQLRNRINPSVLDYALRLCQQTYDIPSHAKFTRSQKSNNDEKKGLSDVIRFGKRNYFKRENDLGKYIRFGRK